MKSKTIIILISSVIAIMVIAVLVAMMKSEKNFFKSSSAENETMNALIDNYDDITDVDTQVAVWMHVFKTCPKWKKYVQDQFNRHGSDDGTLESRYMTEINWVINKGRKPKDYLKTCDETIRYRAERYSSLTDSEKKQLWVEIFNTCPEMMNIIRNQAIKWRRSPQEQVEIEVDWFMNQKKRDPINFISSCK